MVLAVNRNSGLAGSHGAVIAAAEVVALEAVGLIVISCIVKEIILIVKWIVIIIIRFYDQVLVILILIDELQAVDHTSIIPERILLALDGLKLSGIQVAAAVCIVPCLFIIIIFVIVEIFSGYYLEPSLAYTGTVIHTAEVFPCLCIMGVFSAACKDAVSIAVRTANCVRLCSYAACAAGAFLYHGTGSSSACTVIAFFLKVILIQGPLCNHCAILVKCVLSAVDGLVFCAVSVFCIYFLAVGVEVEPAALILVIIKCSSSIFVIVLGCFIIGDIQLDPANCHCTVILAAEVINAFLEAVPV